jgi:hypothetical protein
MWIGSGDGGKPASTSTSAPLASSELTRFAGSDVQQTRFRLSAISARNSSRTSTPGRGSNQLPLSGPMNPLQQPGKFEPALTCAEER